MNGPRISLGYATWCAMDGCDWAGSSADYERHRLAAHPQTSFGTRPAGEVEAAIEDDMVLPFHAQVRAMYKALLERDQGEATSFLAGVRFHAGFREHGDDLFRKSADDLRWDEAEEDADRFIYATRRNMLEGAE
jgi:hypothetical protein